MKRILFVCGSGGITSTVAENYVLEACKKRGYDIKTVRCSPTEVYSHLESIDLIVSTTALGNDYKIPVVNGLNLIIGVGKEQVIDEIIKHLKD
ncbi:MAG: PTS sugar transporter subunit IIB [Anaerolineaceae bacterium]|jgi:PTS system galactitol-specific IIB component